MEEEKMVTLETKNQEQPRNLGELEDMINEYNQDVPNFIIVETLKIFKQSKDESSKLQALELLRKMS